MTLIVGIKCSDGVVLASDSAATYGTGYQTTIGQQHVTKIHVIKDEVLFCSTGAIGVAQLLIDRIETLHAGGKLRGDGPVAIMRALGAAISEEVSHYFRASQASASLVGTHAAAMPLICKSLIAISVRGQPHLFQFNEVGVPEQASDELPFVALGSGQPIADPFLAFLKRVLWRDRQPTLPEGRFGASWTVRHAIQTNPGGVGGRLQLVSLSTNGGGESVVQRLESEGSEQEHFQSIDSVEDAIRRHVRGIDETTYEVPKPIVASNAVNGLQGQ